MGEEWRDSHFNSIREKNKKAGRVSAKVSQKNY